LNIITDGSPSSLIPAVNIRKGKQRKRKQCKSLLSQNLLRRLRQNWGIPLTVVLKQTVQKKLGITNPKKGYYVPSTKGNTTKKENDCLCR